jgi:hypothetical protein
MRSKRGRITPYVSQTRSIGVVQDINGLYRKPTFSMRAVVACGLARTITSLGGATIYISAMQLNVHTLLLALNLISVLLSSVSKLSEV